MKKRYAILSLLLVLLFLFIPSAFYRFEYCPVIGKMIAKNKLQKYVDTQMENPPSLKVYFDWYNGNYKADFGEHDFLNYSLRENTINDSSIGDREADMLRGLLPDRFVLFTETMAAPDIWVWTTIDADDYTKQWWHLMLYNIYNTENLSTEESIERPADIAMDLISSLGSNYNFTSIQIHYLDKNGIYDTILHGKEPLTHEKLVEATEKLPKEEEGSGYREWLKENGLE